MKRPSRLGGLEWGTDNVLLRRFAPYLLFGLITLLVIVVYLEDHRVFATIELGIQDMMVSMGRRPEPPTDVVVVNIDDNAVAKLGPWPWDPERVGYLVGMLAEYKPKAVGLDLELPTEFSEDPAGNQFLAEMITRAGNVVLPLRFTLAETGRLNRTAPEFVAKSSLVVVDEAARLLESPYPAATAVSFPYPEAGKAASGMGHVNTWMDVDNIVRRDPMVVNYEGDYYPSMALQLVRLASGVHRSQVRLDPGRGVTLASRAVPTDKAGMMWIDYRGPAGTIPSVSAARVLEGQADGKAITDKIVVVGVTASGYGTALRTSSSSGMPRAERIATVAANILDDRYITAVNLSTLLDLSILVAIGAFCAVVLPRVGLSYRLVILLVMAFALLNLNYVLYSSFKLITKTLYPTLEILAFLLFAPVIKSHQAASTKWAKKPVRKPAPRVADRTLRSPSVASAVAPDATDNVPVRHVREGGPAGVISGLSQTMAFDTTGQHPLESTKQSDTPEPSIALTPTFEPPTMEVEETDAQPRDVMDESPHPMGLDEAAATGEIPQEAGLQATDLKRLGRYKILGVLGEGAMGTVYKGKDPAIDRLVALKTIRVFGASPVQAAELRERLVREAKAAGKLSHPNIVTIYDVGTEGDLDYIAMEYLEGYTLEQVVRKRVQLNYRILAKMLSQVCDALDYAHRGGIVHRDIKPANIMVLDDFKVKVTDFGIARFESSSMSMTQTGVAVGTPYYIAPEQLRGGPVDRRCDIFSLGVVAYELLVHRRPFAGENISALIYAITQTNPDPPSRVDANIPGLFDVVIGKALAKDPRERYQTADEMAHDLAVFVEDLAGAKAFRI